MEIKIARSPNDISRFLALPRSLYTQQHLWVESLQSEQANLVNQKRHPFYAKGSRAEAEFFLAIDPSSDQVLGRVAAIHNRSQVIGHGHGVKVGHFGFFESLNSQEVANKLLEAASNWLREKSVELMLGPASHSQNYEYGLLIQGFEQPHRFLLPYHPPYYQQLLSGYGLVKAKDLLVFSIDLTNSQLKQRLARDAQRVEEIWQQRFPHIRVRPIDLRRFDEEIKLMSMLMSNVFMNHWDYTSMSVQELRFTFGKLRPVLDPNLVLIMERKEVPVGIVLVIPDLNEAIRKLKIRHGTLQLVELFLRIKLSPIGCPRLLALGVVQDQPAFGLVQFLLLRLYQNLIAGGYSTLDAHWILEDNLRSLGILRRYDLQPDRIYRVYSKSLN